MHYKNGREAKEYDPIVFADYKKQVKVGIVHSLVAGTDTCNAQVTFIVPGRVDGTCINLKDVYHAEDCLLTIEPLAKASQGGQIGAK